MEHMEKMLSTGVKDQNQHHLSVAILQFQAKAHSVYKDLSTD